MDITIQREGNGESPIAIALKRIIERAGEVGAKKRLTSPALYEKRVVLPWHWGKNDWARSSPCISRRHCRSGRAATPTAAQNTRISCGCFACSLIAAHALLRGRSQITSSLFGITAPCAASISLGNLFMNAAFAVAPFPPHTRECAIR